MDHRGHRLSIGTSLVLVVVIPLLVAVGLASSVVLHQSSTRRQAVLTQQSSLVLDSLLRARVDVYAEYVASQAITAARVYNISVAEVDALLGVDFPANQVTARRAVDHDAVFGPSGTFAAEHTQLLAVRKAIDNKTETFPAVESFFSGLGAKIDDQWQDTFDRLVRANGSTDSPVTRSRLAALQSSFEAFTSGLGEETLKGGGSLETVLTATGTPAEVQSLIVSSELFQQAVKGFPGSLGPRAALAWTVVTKDPVNIEFSNDVQRAIAVGLTHGTPTYATNTAAIAAVGRAEVRWDASLSHLVLASSTDLRAATSAQATSATKTLVVTFISMLLLVLAAIGAVLFLGRAVRRPLLRIVAAAASVREGELELPDLDESGPRELALAAGAFNQMSSTLRMVQEQAIALSEGDLDDPVLARSLPGRTGEALQSALIQLQLSLRAGESQTRGTGRASHARLPDGPVEPWGGARVAGA